MMLTAGNRNTYRTGRDADLRDCRSSLVEFRTCSRSAIHICVGSHLRRSSRRDAPLIEVRMEGPLRGEIFIMLFGCQS